MPIRGKLLLGILLIFSAPTFSQQLKGTITIPKKTVFVGEPCEVRIAVSTSTWFTSGVTPNNLQIDGAYTIYFRPVSQTKRVNGETFSVVELIYHVFPYRSGELEFPALDIEVESPAPGQYKGSRKTVKTRGQTIQVRSIPPDIEADNWLVTSQLTVRNSWSKDLAQVKVGDVITRSIYRKAQGTIPEMIPGIQWDTITGVSIYSGATTQEREKGKLSIYTEKTERVQYLFEKEGAVVVPERTIYWWHPQRKKLYKKTIESVTIQVQANPNLGILESIKDSLRVETEVQALAAEEENPIDWKKAVQTVLGALILIGLVFYLYRWLSPLIRRFWTQRRERILASENHYFQQFLKTPSSDHQKLNALYNWLHVLLGRKTTIWELRDLVEDTQQLQEIDKLLNSVSTIDWNHEVWKEIRAHLIQSQKKTAEDSKVRWINP